jgi:hypothetical protein
MCCNYSLDGAMILDITFETEDDKWKWGGILGGVGLALVTTGLTIGCFCKRYLRRRASERATRNAMRALYAENASKTVLCVDGPAATSVPSAPPYDNAL